MKTLRQIFLYLILASLILCICPIPTAQAKANVTLGSKVSYSEGYTTIAWSVVGADADVYNVSVKAVTKGDAVQTNWRVGSTHNHRFQTWACVPGKTYQVTISDGSSNILAQKQYTIPSPATFKDGRLKNTSVKISIAPRKQASGGGVKKLDSLSATSIASGAKKGTTNYGIRYEMKMPQLAKKRAYFVTLVFEAPNGYIDVEYAHSVTFKKVSNGYQTLWWDITGSDFFKNLYDANGYIPVGKYKVHLYWDGMWVNTSSFKVT